MKHLAIFLVFPLVGLGWITPVHGVGVLFDDSDPDLFALHALYGGEPIRCNVAVPFSRYPKLLSQVPTPGLLHPVCYQPAGQAVAYYRVSGPPAFESSCR